MEMFDGRQLSLLSDWKLHKARDGPSYAPHPLGHRRASFFKQIKVKRFHSEASHQRVNSRCSPRARFPFPLVFLHCWANVSVSVAAEAVGRGAGGSTGIHRMPSSPSSQSWARARPRTRPLTLSLRPASQLVSLLHHCSCHFLMPRDFCRLQFLCNPQGDIPRLWRGPGWSTRG